MLAESQEKLEKFLLNLNYEGDDFIGGLLVTGYCMYALYTSNCCILITVLDDKIGGYLRFMVISWPFGLRENTFVVLKAYHYPRKAKDPTK